MRDSFAETQKAASALPTCLQAQVVAVPEVNRYCTTSPLHRASPPLNLRSHGGVGTSTNVRPTVIPRQFGTFWEGAEGSLRQTFGGSPGPCGRCGQEKGREEPEVSQHLGEMPIQSGQSF